MSGADPAERAAEIGESRERLADLLGEQVDGYCYSYGDLDDHAVGAVRAAGYDYGCAIWHGENTGRYALPRTYVGAKDTAWRLWAKQCRARLHGGQVPLATMESQVAAQ
jgi:peptidoglycan/xylan/chitin deacetylase (PgdA/CDA1 family)